MTKIIFAILLCLFFSQVMGGMSCTCNGNRYRDVYTITNAAIGINNLRANTTIQGYPKTFNNDTDHITFKQPKCDTGPFYQIPVVYGAFNATTPIGTDFVIFKRDWVACGCVTTLNMTPGHFERCSY